MNSALIEHVDAQEGYFRGESREKRRFQKTDKELWRGNNRTCKMKPLILAGQFWGNIIWPTGRTDSGGEDGNQICQRTTW